MLEWFQDEDVFNTVHKHHIVIVPCTETFDIPHTTLYPRLMRRFRNEVKTIQHRASVGDKTKCCNCISTGENSPKLIFIPCMRKNKESGIICPDIDVLRKALIKIRHCTLNARVSIAFDVYSFFYYDFEKEVASYNLHRSRLWPFVEREIRRILGNNEYTSIGLFTYRKEYENPLFAHHNKSEANNTEGGK